MRKSGEERKMELIRTALEMITELGPDRVSTTRLAGRVGISQPAVFRHFPTTNHLWLAVARWAVEEAGQRWRNALDGAGDNYLERIRALVNAQLGFISDHPGVAMLILSQEHNTRNAELNRAFTRLALNFHDSLARLVESARATGLVDESLPGRETTLLILSLVPGLTTRWLVSGRSFDLTSQGEKLLDLLLDRLALRTEREKRDIMSATGKVTIDTKACVGCGQCEQICPGVFELDDDLGQSTVLSPDSEAGCVDDAIDSCPVEAISREG